ncbi:MAG: hypothetical protein IT348_19600 [Candidatus Eisenbacteria bacterium]|nr:hypothetical protein [Candidatus Eisenbacteria bacterium]
MGLLVLISLVLVTGAARAALSNARWGMPDPKVVIADAKGSDRLDRLAQMSATLQLLASVVISLAPQEPPGSLAMTDPRDVELYRAYRNSSFNVDNAAYAITGDEFYPDPHAARTRWQQRNEAYRGDAEFIRRNLRRYVPAPLVEKYLAIDGRAGQRNRFAQWKAQDQLLGFESFIQPVAGPALEFLSAARGGTPQLGSRSNDGAAGIARALLLLMLVIWAWIDLGRSARLAPDDPTKLLTGKRTYDLRRQAGTVHDPTKQIENITHVSGGYNSNVTTTHTRLTHVQFFIRSRAGEEEAINDVNIQFPVREGHVVSIASIAHPDLKRWPYVLMRNHSLSTYLVKDDVLSSFANEKRFRRGFAASMVLFATWVLALVFKAFGTFVVLLILMLIALAALRNRRVGELRQSLVRDLVPVLDQHAQREM